MQAPKYDNRSHTLIFAKAASAHFTFCNEGHGFKFYYMPVFSFEEALIINSSCLRAKTSIDDIRDHYDLCGGNARSLFLFTLERLKTWINKTIEKCDVQKSINVATSDNLIPDQHYMIANTLFHIIPTSEDCSEATRIFASTYIEDQLKSFIS
jgi:hypothetical protein